MRTIAHVDVAEVRSVFLRLGHTGLVRTYGRSNAVNRQLIALAGGPALLAERAAAQRTGRKAGGSVLSAKTTIVAEA